MDTPIKSAESAYSDEVWETIDAVVDRLEESWKSGSSAELSQFAPPADSPIHETILAELIKVDLEHRWKLGAEKRIEEYLQEWPEIGAHPELVRDLLEAECLTRALFTAAEATRQEIDSRFPGIAEKIRWDFIEGELVNRRYRQSILREGQRFGRDDRYEIRELLGQGGMGTVYRAHDSRLDREVALKVPLLDPHLKQTVLDRFLREAKSAAKIRHPNVCPIFDADQVGETYYLTMALIEGQPLSRWMESRALCTKEAATVAMKLARALSAVHAEGFLHRDVKPSNVIIDESDEPWLMDFGLAGQAIEEFSTLPSGIENAAATLPDSRLTQSKTLLGTVPYMAPELFRGEKASPQSDIYSLGVLLYKMLVGWHPFVTEASGQFTLQSLQADPAPMRTLRAEVDAKLEAICLKALAKNPAERFASAAELADDLRKYVETATEPATPPKKRRRFWLLSGILFVLACFAGIFLYLKTGEGKLALKINEKGIEVKIDDREMQVESENAEVILSVGEHRIEISKDGFEPYADTITLSWRGDVVKININLKSKYISRWIESDNALSSMAVSHDGTALFITLNKNHCAPRVQAIDLKTGEIRQTITSPIQFEDHQCVVSSLDDRYLFVSNYCSKVTVTTRIDTQTKNTRNDLDTGGCWSRIIGVTPDGKKLAVTAGSDGRVKDENNDQLAIVDIDDGRFDMLGKVSLDDEPEVFQLAFSADSRFVYFVTRTRKSQHPTLYEVALGKPYRVSRKLEISDSNLTGIALSSKRNRIYISDGVNRQISVVDLETFQAIEDWEVEGQAPGSLVLDPAENTLAVLCPATRKLVFLDPEDGAVLGSVAGLRENAFNLKFSPKGDELFVAHGVPTSGIAVVNPKPFQNDCRLVFSSNRAGESHQLYVIGPDGKDLHQLVRSKGTDCSPRWSPDGRRIAYLSDQKGLPRICLVNRNGKQDIILEKTDPIWEGLPSGNGSLLDWSPDGTRILFIGRRKQAIRTVDVKTGEVETLFNGDIEGKYASHNQVQWDPRDGTIIVLSATSASGDDYGIFRFDPKSKRFQTIFRSADLNYGYASPAVSRDGKKIAVSWRELGTTPKPTPLILMNADGSDPLPVKCTEETVNFAPRWTSTGKAITYAGQQGYRTHLFFLRLTDAKPVQLTNGNWDDLEPDVWGEVKEY